MTGGMGTRNRGEKSPAFTPPEKLLGLFYYATSGPGSKIRTSIGKTRGSRANVWFWGGGWVPSCVPLPSFSRRYLPGFVRTVRALRLLRPFYPKVPTGKAGTPATWASVLGSRQRGGRAWASQKSATAAFWPGWPPARGAQGSAYLPDL